MMQKGDVCYMIKALLVGVSKYNNHRNDLPKCLNDLYAMNKALIIGLNVEPENILLCGKFEKVDVDDFYNSFNNISGQINSTDTFIFYFSGHGAKKSNSNFLAFSDGFICIEEIIKLIDSINCCNKIVMIDSCHSGNKNIALEPVIDINQTADEFVGHGCAVMASCDLEEVSGFDQDVPLSLYTRILCDAITARFLIREGKKSLEDIKTYVDRLVNVANKNANPIQHNAFRSSVVGTIFFDVENYTPYNTQDIYIETDEYIIYSVNPVHANVKRISLEVILRFPCSENDVVRIANEIKRDALHYEVYDSQRSENRFRGVPNNIIFIYYGYDESDIINHTYAFRTVWTDEHQDRNHWYSLNKHSSIIDDVWIETEKSYDFMKKFINDHIVDDETLIKITRNCMYKMILCAEKFIAEYREYINRTITENELIANVSGISSEIRNLYFEQTDFPIASNALHEWQTEYAVLAAAIDNFVLCYNKNSLKNRDRKNRAQLFEITIKRYNANLEKIKKIDADLAKMLNKSEGSYE